MEFNLLPLVAQLEIFSYLPARQVMKIREVCKHWNGLINIGFKIKGFECNQYNRPIWLGNRATGCDFNFLCIRSFLDYTRANPMFSRVKFLNAYLYPDYAELEEAFDLLNSFRALEQTSFDCYVSDLYRNNLGAIEKKQFVVSLDRLKDANFTFNLDEEDDKEALVSKVSIVLDLPHLLYLAVDSLRVFTVKYPEKLRTLSTDDLFEDSLDYSRCTSLTRMFISNGSNLRLIASYIKRLPSLRELYLSMMSKFYDPHNVPDHLQEPSSNKAVPRVIYCDFEISLNQIIALLEGELWPDATRLISRYLHRSLDNNRLANTSTIAYNTIAHELNDAEMFGLMLRKFPKIDSLCIDGAVADPNRLLKFIGQFQVNRLEFVTTSLTRWFFEKLPESGSSIKNLVMRVDPTISIPSEDFDFICKLTNLIVLDLFNCRLPLDFLARLLREVKSIEYVHLNSFGQPDEFYFLLSVNQMRITLRTNEGRFYFKVSDQEAVEFFSELSSRLKNADGYVRPQELIVMLRHVQLEKETHLFMMRKFVYEQRHSIGLSREQWLNLLLVDPSLEL